MQISSFDVRVETKAALCKTREGRASSDVWRIDSAATNRAWFGLNDSTGMEQGQLAAVAVAWKRVIDVEGEKEKKKMVMMMTMAKATSSSSSSSSSSSVGARAVVQRMGLWVW